MPLIWRIYFVSNCRYTTPPKGKLVVIVCISEKPMGFLINTEIPKFIQNNPSLVISQVEIKASDYRCLTHNSYIDCVQLYSFENAELEDREEVNKQTKLAIKMAVSICDAIERGYKKLILN